MNCGHATQLVDAWIDNEVDTGTANAMSLHLGECAACSALAQQRIDTRRFVRANAPRFPAPETLRERLQARFDAPFAGRLAPRAAWRQALALVVVAAVSAGGGYLLGRPPPPAADFEHVVAGHVASLKPAGRLTDIASSQRHAVKPWFQGKVDFSPPVRDLSAEGFVLLGARLEKLGHQHPAAAVVYRLRAHFVTLYVWPDAQSSSTSVQFHNVRGFSVATWSEAGLRHTAVSDLNATDLLRFTALMQAAP